MENLEELKVGDKVIVSNGFGKRVDTVTRLTKTLVVVGHFRFNKSNGFEYGGRGCRSPHIVLATPERLAEIEEEKKREEILNKVTHYPWNKLSTEELEKVYELINKERIGKKEQDITGYMTLTYKLMQWATRKPDKRGILVVTYDEDRCLSGAVPAGDLVGLGVAIANEMNHNKDFRVIVEEAVKLCNEEKK